jgi:hypothetical protein
MVDVQVFQLDEEPPTNESLEYLSRIQIMKVVQILSPISNLIFVVAVGLVEHVEHSAQFLSVSPHTHRALRNRAAAFVPLVVVVVVLPKDYCVLAQERA